MIIIWFIGLCTTFYLQYYECNILRDYSSIAYPRWNHINFKPHYTEAALHSHVVKPEVRIEIGIQPWVAVHVITLSTFIRFGQNLVWEPIHINKKMVHHFIFSIIDIIQWYILGFKYEKIKIRCQVTFLVISRTSYRSIYK